MNWRCKIGIHLWTNDCPQPRHIHCVRCGREEAYEHTVIRLDICNTEEVPDWYCVKEGK